jgi:hypothetical protein
MMNVKTQRVGNWLVSGNAEIFRIFPKNRNSETIPVTRINRFLYLRCTKTGTMVTFKNYLHMKKWYWRDSRDKKPCHEIDVFREIARMLQVTEAEAKEIAMTHIFTKA